MREVRRRRSIYNVNNTNGHVLWGVADNIYIYLRRNTGSIAAEIYARRGGGV